MKIFLLLAVLGFSGLQTADAQSLKGSKKSVDIQARERAEHDYDRLPNEKKIREYVRAGYLVKITGNSKYAVKASQKYARREVKLFLDRFSSQYPQKCGKLVVTSLSRPLNKQPRNASKKSVHPAGMALDLRIPKKRECQLWIENTTITLELRDVIEVTRERYPAHYHIAVFPEYLSYVKSKTGSYSGTPSKPSHKIHVVEKGESLWSIARRHDITIKSLKSLNGIKSDKVKVGQKLKIPKK